MDCVPSRHGRCSNFELPGNTPGAHPATTARTSTARKPADGKNGSYGGPQPRVNSRRSSQAGYSSSSSLSYLPASLSSSSPPSLYSSTASLQPKKPAAAAAPCTGAAGQCVGTPGAARNAAARDNSPATSRTENSAKCVGDAALGAAPRTSNKIAAADLPDYTPVVPPKFRWGNIDGAEFARAIRMAYDEVAHWRRNVFLLPTGNAGKEFVRELTRLFNAYTQRSALESVALDAIMVACVVLLQKPHGNSKCRDHVAVLERRLRAWNAGDIEGLLYEGRTIQRSLSANRSAQFAHKQEEKLARTFAQLVFTGKIRAAIRYLSENERGGLLSLEDCCGSQTVRDVLNDKHPSARPVEPEALLTLDDVTSQPVHPVFFDQITGDAIRSSALRTQGSAGPSGIDAAGWRRILVSFHRDSRDLCAAIAAFARRLCTDYVEPSSIRAFVACRLVALNKNPGVRPIGICEVLRRIIGKVIMRVVGNDVLQVTGPLQLCAGQEAGGEAAIHAMRSLFREEGTDAILLVDASNAFNNLNRKVALLNIALLCPALSPVLTNCYRGDAQLFVNGETMLSREGVTQGDPLAMAMFALASVPLIRKVATDGAKQAWFADDSGSGGKLLSTRHWWDKLLAYGPKYGYYPNPAKTVLITKSEQYNNAIKLFNDTDIIVTDSGHRYLGGALGSDSFLETFTEAKIAQWVSDVEQLSAFAKSQPHAAFAAFYHGLRHRWTYLTRVLPVSTHLLQPLETVLRQTFLPAVTGQPACSDHTYQLLSLPPRHGGLGVTNPLSLPHNEHTSSIVICQPLVKAILNQEGDSIEIRAQQRQRKTEEQMRRRQHLKDQVATIARELPSDLQRSVAAASEKGASAWLTTIPIENHGFTLHKGAFRDAVGLRYGWPLQFCPEKCVCGSKFEPDHQLVCRQGGYISLRHNELRDFTASLLKEVCVDVCTEPLLQPVTGENLPSSSNRTEGARLDVRAKGFWDRNLQDAFFDIRVFHPHASSYRGTNLASLYRQHEAKKKNEYAGRVRQIEHGCFTPLVFATTGGIGKEAEVVFKRLASLMSEKTTEPYSSVMGWIRSRISFSLLRSALICLRGSRSSPNRADNCIAVQLAEGQFYA